jgi:hypothetical protein
MFVSRYFFDATTHPRLHLPARASTRAHKLAEDGCACALA